MISRLRQRINLINLRTECIAFCHVHYPNYSYIDNNRIYERAGTKKQRAGIKAGRNKTFVFNICDCVLVRSESYVV